MDLSLFIKALSDAEKWELKSLLEQDLASRQKNDLNEMGNWVNLDDYTNLPVEPMPDNAMKALEWARRHPTTSTRIRTVFLKHDLYMHELYDMDDRELSRFPNIGKVCVAELRKFLDEDRENLEAMGIMTKW